LQIAERPFNGRLWQADAAAECLKKHSRYRLELHPLAVDQQGKVLVVVRVDGSVDDVIKRGEAKPNRCFQQREVFQVTVAIADKREDNQAAKKLVEINLGTR